MSMGRMGGGVGGVAVEAHSQVAAQGDIKISFQTMVIIISSIDNSEELLNAFWCHIYE